MMISCVMPTYNRRAFIPAAILCYQQQTWKERELIILDDGEDKIEDLIPPDPTIHYYPLDKKYNTGAKRNMVNSLASADIIAHFDDDDWCAPERLEHNASFLHDGCIMTGYSITFFWDVINKRASFFRSRIPNGIYGCTLTYHKSCWIGNCFPQSVTGSDYQFMLNVMAKGPEKVIASMETNHIVSRIHGTNISIKPTLSMDTAIIPKAFWVNEDYRLSLLEAKK